MNQAYGNFINGQWQHGKGERFSSIDPATNECLWSGRCASEDEIHQALESSRKTLQIWSKKSLEERISALNAFKTKLVEKKESLALTISKEVGKPFWESLTEVQAMIGKIDISIDAQQDRCPIRTSQQNTSLSVTRHKPHGILAVFGPYNFPGHLPNGHIVPALLAGNVVVFKPSDLTPLVAQETVKIWEESGLPNGVLTLLQGGVKTAISLANHPQINGLLFTGSWKTGSSLAAQYVKSPGKILALEMGGNNPLVVDEITDIKTAAHLTFLSAYLTSGQRCTCARKLIVPKGPKGDDFIVELMRMIDHVTIGPHSLRPEPFMGPLISQAAADHLMEAQETLLTQGALPLKPMKKTSKNAPFLTPGFIDVTPIANLPDEEYFGPLLQLIRVNSFEEALAEANNTSYGLVAALLSDNQDKYRIFYETVRAGIINWNTQTTGASSLAPFGGIGKSGNFHPSAYYAADYCSYPVASLEAKQMAIPSTPTPGLNIL